MGSIDKVYVGLSSKEDSASDGTASTIAYTTSKEVLIEDLKSGLAEKDGAKLKSSKSRSNVEYRSIGQEYIQMLDGMRKTIPVVFAVIPFVTDHVFDHDIVDFVRSNGIKFGKEGNWDLFELDGHHLSGVASAVSKHKALVGFSDVLPKMFIIGLVAIYDGFLGNLIKEAIRLRPGMLSQDKTLTLADLLTLQSVENATDFLVDKEVDGIIRGSHRQHLIWLNKHLNIDVEETFEKIPDFLEICERRNLFTHNNGIINQSYISFLKQERIPSNEINIGDALGAKPKYMHDALNIFYELGIELCHIVWRKTAKEEAEQADTFLNNVAYELLASGRHELARRILQYGVNLRDHHSAQIKLMMVINLANAFRLLGRKAECKDTLSSEDWSATSSEFRLAVAALEERWQDAADLMREIGDRGAVGKVEYKNWPVFSLFICQDEFKSAYLEIFGQPFEGSPASVERAAQIEAKAT